MKIDNRHKFIDTYTTTDASVHDSQALDDLLTGKDENRYLWADEKSKKKPLKDTN